MICPKKKMLMWELCNLMLSDKRPVLDRKRLGLVLNLSGVPAVVLR